MIEIKLKDGEKIAFCCDLHIMSKTPSSRLDDILSTAKSKLEDMREKCIKENVKHLFFEGDIFHIINTPIYCINTFNDIIKDYIKSGITVYSIIGNHDIYRNEISNSFNESPLNLFFKNNLIKHINLSQKVVINKDVLLTPLDYSEEPIKADKKYEINILLAHMFFDTSEMIAGNDNLTKDIVRELGYDLVVLGHDHVNYQNVKCGKSIVVRSGSLLRITKEKYNFNRDICFVVLDDLYNICNETIRLVSIEHKSFEDVVKNSIIADNNANTFELTAKSIADKLTAKGENTDTIRKRIENDKITDDKKLENEIRQDLLKRISNI